MHWHEEIELIYCLEGRYTVQICDDQYNIAPGHVLFINSGELHSVTVIEEGLFAFIEFGSSLVGRDFNLMANNAFSLRQLDLNADEDRGDDEIGLIRDSLSVIMDELRETRIGTHNMIKAHIMALFVLLLRAIPVKEEQDVSRMDRIFKRNKINEVFDHVEKHYARNITLKEAAKVAHYSERSFLYAFKLVTGMTFHSYLNHYRVERAIELLPYREYSIEYIGYLVGIPVPKSFSRIFCRVMGISPSEYRRRLFANKLGEAGPKLPEKIPDTITMTTQEIESLEDASLDEGE